MVSWGRNLSVRRQCKLLSLVRSGFYYSPKGEIAENLKFMKIIDKQFLDTPWYGSRQMARHMQHHGHKCGRHRVRRLMRLMRLMPIYQTPNASKKHPQRKVYPYLLRGLKIDRPNQVWCTDITYIPIRRGFLCLVAIMDWATRKVLAWRISNTLDTEFCIKALKEALANTVRRKSSTPTIPLMICKQTTAGQRDSQFTSHEFTQVLKDTGVKISMDGRGRWIDNRMIERLWRSLKYECVYIRAFETGSEAKI